MYSIYFLVKSSSNMSPIIIFVIKIVICSIVELCFYLFGIILFYYIHINI